MRRIEIRSQHDMKPHTIVIDYFDPPGGQPSPVLLVLPILGGGNEVAQIFAKHFASHGYASLIVHRQKGYKKADRIEKLNPIFKQIVLDHKQVIDWIQTQEDLDPERIGLFGVSAGAIKGALVSALDDRIAATVLALAGGDVPYILAYSTDKGIAKRRNKILAQYQIDADELYEKLDDEFEHDPLDYASYIDADRTMLILARFDAVVPYQKGMELRQAIGNPQTTVLPTGHYGAVLYVPYIKRSATRFFDSWLRSP